MDLAQFTWSIVPFLSVLTVFGQASAVALLATLLYERIAKKRTRIGRWVEEYGLLLMLFVAATATAGSLYFSEVAGWTPCKYCWIQRIFMYPQTALLTIAIIARDRYVVRYTLALCVIGVAYASYHYFIQMHELIASPINPATPCDASGESCVSTPFTYFGYITIPMMALTAFVLNLIGSAMIVTANRRTT